MAARAHGCDLCSRVRARTRPMHARGRQRARAPATSASGTSKMALRSGAACPFSARNCMGTSARRAWKAEVRRAVAWWKRVVPGRWTRPNSEPRVRTVGGFAGRCLGLVSQVTAWNIAPQRPPLRRVCNDAADHRSGPTQATPVGVYEACTSGLKNPTSPRTKTSEFSGWRGAAGPGAPASPSRRPRPPGCTARGRASTLVRSAGRTLTNSSSRWPPRRARTPGQAAQTPHGRCRAALTRASSHQTAAGGRAATFAAPSGSCGATSPGAK